MSDSGDASVVGLPRETDLQFFAYGIFRPDEIAWPRIISFVESSDESSIDGWELCERNGLPLATRNRDNQLSGHRVRFTDPLSAYEVIGNVEPSGEYKWESVIDSDGEKCNLLAAKKSEISTEPSQHWSSSRDPLFQFGMAFVSGVIRDVAPRLAESGPFGKSESDWKPYFECQAAFLTLWSIFERYAAFRYGAEFKTTTTAKIHETARSEKFMKAITKAYVDQTFKVYSVRENRPKKIVRDGRLDPKKAVNAWYQVRNNLTHRGKAAFKENRLLLTATIDLYNTLYFFLGDEVAGLNQQWGDHVHYISRQEIMHRVSHSGEV